MMFQQIFRLASCYRNRFIFYYLPGIFIRRHLSAKKFVSAPVVSLGLWGFAKKDEFDINSKKSKESLLAKADALYENQEYQKVYDILNNYRDSKDVEVLWRLSRTLYYMAKTASDVEAKKMIYEAYNLVIEASSINDNHWAVHKWIAILIDSKTNYEGMKEKIKTLNIVKDHMLIANKLNPNDATTLHILGHYCYSVADLAWYQKKIASAIFGKVPDSSFEEALTYLEAAEKADPLFYSHNLLLLGKTYLKLSRKDEAIKYLKMTTEYPVRNDDDQKAKQEATKILSSI
ncbi:regulator of microtubule dynamics protein 1 [Microplitis demolitor]|uniref:regulator of microtubule dynamics protein 1 n=1 Tax=Microplitis demolitor TaxID=69319 RepID=UPI0004CDC703|nr:regulator of microtubule dynamics protein 1 [Microplitis demolitor]